MHAHFSRSKKLQEPYKTQETKEKDIYSRCSMKIMQQEPALFLISNWRTYPTRTILRTSTMTAKDTASRRPLLPVPHCVRTILWNTLLWRTLPS